MASRLEANLSKQKRRISLQNEGETKNKEKSALQIIEEDAAKHKKLLISVAAILFSIMAVFFYPDVKAMFLIIALIALGAVSRLWQRFIPLPIGVNFIMLSTVVAGILYGPFAGLVVGFMSLFLSAFLALDDIATMFPSLFAISLAGYLAGYVPVSEISLGGLALTVLYDIIISVSYFLLGLANIRTFIFVATHIVFNYFVFYNVAPVLAKLLA